MILCVLNIEFKAPVTISCVAFPPVPLVSRRSEHPMSTPAEPVQASLLELARGARRGAKGVGHEEDGRPLSPRIFVGHKRGRATFLLRENRPGPPEGCRGARIFLSLFSLEKSPFSLFLSLFSLKKSLFPLFPEALRLRVEDYPSDVAQ